MSKQDFEAVVSLSVNNVTAGTMHTWRELSFIGLEAQTLVDTADKVSGAVAPHYHALMVEIEQSVRKDPAFSGKSDLEIAAECIEVAEGVVSEQVKMLHKEKDWGGKKLPTVSDQAYRKIKDAWSMGGSLLQLTTASACETFAREERAKKRAEKANKHAPGSADNESAHGFPELDLPPEVASELPALLKALKAAADANKGHTITQIHKATEKLNNIAKTSLAAIGGKVVNG